MVQYPPNNVVDRRSPCRHWIKTFAVAVRRCWRWRNSICFNYFKAEDLFPQSKTPQFPIPLLGRTFLTGIFEKKLETRISIKPGHSFINTPIWFNRSFKSTPYSIKRVGPLNLQNGADDILCSWINSSSSCKKYVQPQCSSCCNLDRTTYVSRVARRKLLAIDLYHLLPLQFSKVAEWSVTKM